MRLCFIWHMHQPYYKDLEVGDYLMPWVRLHGTKDYLDMVTILDRFPRIKQCFNLVPSLIEQVEDYAAGTAEDRQLHLSRKRAADLSDEEKLEISREFFSANYATMIKPYRRYDELHKTCQTLSDQEKLRQLSEQDYRDLQVWFNATWIDPSLRKDPSVEAIYGRGHSFSEAEKQALLDYQSDILGQIIPAYRQRQDEGRIEVSFSPYYHPILPLLIDTDVARMALPQIKLPQQRFSHPEDADYQVGAAAELYRSLFARDRFGMWPSEGSVSEAILPILARHGVTWIASDEEVYLASVATKDPQRAAGRKPAGLGYHQPFLVGQDGETMGILFRDHTLSDKLGFVYSSWNPERAAADFVAELHRLDKTLSKGTGVDPVVAIILDGENAWEFYPNDGIDFLSALYEKLEADERIETILPREIFAAQDGISRLPNLHAGSWINHNFRVWIGHEEDNRAWDLLKATRDRLVSHLEANPDFPPDKRNLAWKEIYIAEGSDWCWWYGDEHQTSFFELFDRLFRKHLLNVWQLIDVSPPIELLRPIRQLTKQADFTEPTDWVSPVLDGRETHFFEWFGAGKLECFKLGGAMHRADRVLHQILFGYDRENIYLRLDLESTDNATNLNYSFKLDLYTGKRYYVTVDDREPQFSSEDSQNGDLPESPVRLAADRLIELSITRDALEMSEEQLLFFSVTLLDKKKVVEKWPAEGYVSFRLPSPGETLFWEV